MSTETRITPAALMLTAGLVAADVAFAKEQIAYPSGSQPSFTGPENLFTGKVSVDIAFPDLEQTGYSGAFVTFEPGARTAWHDHPKGQHMVVTKGTAITATRSGQVLAFSEGEAVWCPEDTDHWHGSTPQAAMTHFVVTGSEDGSAVNWKEKVTDEQYHAAIDAVAHDEPVYQVLTPRSQYLATVGALAASDDISGVGLAVGRALDDGVSINELKEAFIHLYPYAGFPKSLNALGAMMQVVEARKAEGKEDLIGDEAEPLPEGGSSLEVGTQVQTELVGRPVSGPLFDFAPVANTFLQKHLFGDVFARGVLDHRDREILTLAILSAMEGTDPQILAHVGMAMNSGVTEQEMRELAELLSHRLSHRAGQRLVTAINTVLS